jgi:GxxExxY protein
VAKKNLNMANLIYKNEAYQIIGACMEVHRILGRGLKEIVYTDALEHEFRLRNIPFEREKKYEVLYKDVVLPHSFYADFVCYGNIILEIKAANGNAEEFYKQILNYMAIAKSPLGLLVNFNMESLFYKRMVL